MLSSWVRTVSVAMFVASFAAGMVLVSWHEVVEVSSDTLLTTLIAVVIKGESVSVVSAAIAGAFEGGAFIVVIAYEMVKRGFDRGRVEGRAEGRAEASRLFAAYLRRMQKAQERGEDFDEPPPLFDDAEEHDRI